MLTKYPHRQEMPIHGNGLHPWSYPDLHFIPKYARYEKRHKNLAAHVSPAFRVEDGDTVTVGQCRPLSKTVRTHYKVYLRQDTDNNTGEIQRAACAPKNRQGGQIFLEILSELDGGEWTLYFGSMIAGRARTCA
jgi:ribosomal protein S17